MSISAGPRQQQPYTVDARWAQAATGVTFHRNRKNKRFDNQSHNKTTHKHNDELRNMCFKNKQVK